MRALSWLSVPAFAFQWRWVVVRCYARLVSEYVAVFLTPDGVFIVTTSSTRTADGTEALAWRPHQLITQLFNCTKVT